MSVLTIDETLCRRDGICAAECPVAIISWKKGELPVPAPKAAQLCINCGHCVAVCPHGAMAHEKMAPEDCTPLDENLVLSPAHTEHFMRSRRSIRNFKDTPVDRETLSDIIRIASFAPSGHNCQPVHWRVISGRQKIREYTALVIDWMKSTLKENPELGKALYLDMMVGAWKFGIDTVTRNAPTLILAQGMASNPMAPQACTIAMTYLDLAAQSFNLGTCWCGYFLRAATVHAPLADRLGKDRGLTTHAVMMAGYPKFRYHRMPARNTPKITWTDEGQ